VELGHFPRDETRVVDVQLIWRLSLSKTFRDIENPVLGGGVPLLPLQSLTKDQKGGIAGDFIAHRWPSPD